MRIWAPPNKGWKPTQCMNINVTMYQSLWNIASCDIYTHSVHIRSIPVGNLNQFQFDQSTRMYIVIGWLTMQGSLYDTVSTWTRCETLCTWVQIKGVWFFIPRGLKMGYLLNFNWPVDQPNCHQFWHWNIHLSNRQTNWSRCVADLEFQYSTVWPDFLLEGSTVLPTAYSGN